MNLNYNGKYLNLIP